MSTSRGATHSVVPRLGARRPFVARVVARVVAALTIIAVGVIAGAGPAAAHAELLSSTPAAGDQLATPPTEISLLFSEAVELPEIVLIDATGAVLDIGEPTQPSPESVTAAVPTIDTGGYVVTWNAVSADGHPVSGSFTFAVGDAPLPDPSLGTAGGSDGGWWGIALGFARAVQYAGIALGLGLWAFVVLCWWDGHGERTVGRLVVAGAAMLAAGSLGRLVYQSGYVDSSVGDLVRTTAGRSWVTLAVLALPLGLLGSALARLLRRSVHAVALVLLAVLIGRAVATGGHGATGRAPALGTATTIVHVAAMAVWLGGLIGVLICLRRGAEAPVRRFSNVALASVAVLATTGAVQSVRQLETLDALTSSTFGRVLIVKLAVIAVLLTVAALGRFALRSGGLVVQRAGQDERRWEWPQVLRRTVVIEALLAAGVVGVTASLAGASPLAEASSNPINLALVEGDRTAYISIFPAQTGTNTIHVTVDDITIAGPDEITVELAPEDGSIAAIDVEVVDAGPGHVTADAATIPFGGTWVIEVDARYGEFELVTFSGSFSVP